MSVSVSPAGITQDLSYQAADGTFSGTLTVPTGLQTVTADAWAGTAKVGTGSTTVQVVKGQAAQASILILDGTGPGPLPDHGPVITSFAVPSSLATGQQATVQATAADADSDLISFAWSATPSGCGTFSAPAAASTLFTAAVAGTCTVQVVATANGKTDTRSVPVAISAASTALRVHVAAGGRYLEDQNSRPFRIHGDSPWSLISNLTAAEVDTYLADRQARGFNAIIVNLLEHKFAVNAPANRAGQYPFTSHTPGAYDFSTPNEAYFAFADAAIDKAAAAGMLVFLDVMYAGSGGGDEGWWSEVINSVNTQSVSFGYGQFLGNRWKGKGNIVWMLSGDFNPPAGSEGEARLLKIIQGLRAAGATQLATAHLSPTSLSSDWTAFLPNLGIEGVYPGGTTTWCYSGLRAAWQRTTVMPAFLIEPGYEEEGWVPGDPASIRAYEWWAQLSGIAGVFYGHRDVWAFQTATWTDGFFFGSRPWQLSLGTPAALAMGQMSSLLGSLAWQKLVPSGLSGTKTLVTAGGGTLGQLNFVTAAADPAGSLLLAYLPSTGTAARSITLDMTAMAGATHARWWNPTTGVSTNIATGLPNAGTQVFTTPGNNGAAANDWLLILESP